MTESNNPSALRSQREITEALLSLMEKHPYSEITVKQIILEARLARKTFYRNFTSKDDVLLSLMRSILRKYFEIVDSTRSDVLSAVFETAEENRQFLLLLDKNDMLHLTLKCMNEYLPLLRREKLTALNPFTKYFEGADPEYLMALNIGAVWNVISLWIHRGMEDDPEKVRETVERYLYRLAGK
ncbi:TetR/AcrR family transcriptional regulator [Ruminococcus sp.]|uniref:TetR/AcrR family transcriptional regulator n=1 Tax=Ruminococcus sp. TaxID=41978 RepID=UPI0025CD6BCF|nr:TetR/AcrR family transcriptional regulator [Ruminococcus sp.]MBQ8967108.1 TetR/AcrR family transcriptional regulator [Ruminococcus sp.]